MMSSIYYCTLYQKTSLNRTRPPHHHLCAFLFIVILRKSCMFLFSVHFVCPLNFIIYITAAATTTIQQQHIIIERERERERERLCFYCYPTPNIYMQQAGYEVSGWWCITFCSKYCCCDGVEGGRNTINRTPAMAVI
jgi:hypothetical protein